MVGGEVTCTAGKWFPALMIGTGGPRCTAGT